jgi:NNP family nitrate/nitrite transporter-like MFS transporter
LGWHNVLAVAMIPLAAVLVAFSLMAKDNKNSSAGQPSAHYLRALKSHEMLWFCFFYSVTFGGYVGLSSFLPIFFRDQYKVTPAAAGYITALAAFTGSALRPLGGYLSDKFGGTRILTVVLGGIATAYALGSTLPDLKIMIVIIIAGMACLGLGNGSIFQLVPLRFPREIGIATGVVGAVGGIGGFLLPNLLGVTKQITNSFSAAFIVLAALAVTAILLLQVATGKRLQGLAIAAASEAGTGD